MFDKFREGEGEMVEERKEENTNAEESTSTVESGSEIGIGELIGKRAKLEEAIDYVDLDYNTRKNHDYLAEIKFLDSWLELIDFSDFMVSSPI